MTEIEKYHIEGSYYEACNCDAICPCRRQNGIANGLSTYGKCDFLLSWKISKGHLDGTELSGLAACMAGAYNDDEDGKPWRVFIYVDARASTDQFFALSQIFQGKAKGNILFTQNIVEVLGIKRAQIELDHTAKNERINIAEIATAEVLKPVIFDGEISCGIPGHDHPGEESISNLSLNDGAFSWTYSERCGFATDFTYCS